jgi:hypothetical protein
VPVSISTWCPRRTRCCPMIWVREMFTNARSCRMIDVGHSLTSGAGVAAVHSSVVTG